MFDLTIRGTYIRMNRNEREEDEVMSEENIVLYKDEPDEHSGRCECGNNVFKSRVEDGKFYRKCQECGKTKIV